MRAVEAPLAAAGAPLALIGSGEPRHVPAFREATGSGARVLCDPTLATFRAAGLARSALASVHPAALPGALAALLRGHGIGPIRGDPWQQGGALVLSTTGDVRLHHVSRHVSDLVSNAALLRAVDRRED